MLMRPFSAAFRGNDKICRNVEPGTRPTNLSISGTPYASEYENYENVHYFSLFSLLLPDCLVVFISKKLNLFHIFWLNYPSMRFY